MYEWIKDESVRARVAEKMRKIEPLDENSAEFERFVREEMVRSGLFSSDEYRAFSRDFRMHILDEKALNGEGDLGKDFVALGFFDFEWPYRRVFDDEQKAMLSNVVRQWEDDSRFLTHSICCYAMSHYLHIIKDDRDAALEFALKACRKAPDNRVFLSNYTDILLEKNELAILSSTGETAQIDDELKDTLARFESIDEISYDSSFYVYRARLRTCLRRYDDARSDFRKARRLATKMKNAHKIDDAAFAAEIGKINGSQSTATMVAACLEVENTIEDVNKEQRNRFDEMVEDQERRTAELTRKIDEMTEEMNGQRVEMLEFLGFFSGIISFVVASIQIGSDMDFAARALLILVMSGALLAVFGALGMMLDSHSHVYRGEPKSGAGCILHAFSAQSIGIIVVGLILIVVGLAANVLI